MTIFSHLGHWARTSLFAAVAALAFAGSAQASTISTFDETITFSNDDFGGPDPATIKHGIVLDGATQYYEPLLTITAIDQAGEGGDVAVVYDPNIDPVPSGDSDPDLRKPFTGGGNIVAAGLVDDVKGVAIVDETNDVVMDPVTGAEIILLPNDVLSPPGVIEFDFDDRLTVNLIQFDLVDIGDNSPVELTFTGELSGGGTGTVTLVQADLTSGIAGESLDFGDDTVNRVQEFIAGLDPFDSFTSFTSFTIDFNGSGGITNLRVSGDDPDRVLGFIPEPTSICGLFCGLAFLAGRRRRS